MPSKSIIAFNNHRIRVEISGQPTVLTPVKEFILVILSAILLWRKKNNKNKNQDKQNQEQKYFFLLLLLLFFLINLIAFTRKI